MIQGIESLDLQTKVTPDKLHKPCTLKRCGESFVIKTVFLQHQMLVKMWDNSHSQTFLIGMQNSTTVLEDSLAVSHKTKHTLTI